ncbi:MAG: NUDIX domain-containing protein [Candidatus Nanopelagicales bacterium]
MVVPANPVPQRREGWRLAVPTPAELRRPRSDEVVGGVEAHQGEGGGHLGADPVDLTVGTGEDKSPGAPLPRAEPAPAAGPDSPARVEHPSPNPGNLPRPGAAAPAKPKKVEKPRLAPAGLGRAGKKLRHNGFRTHRLPKVEETSAGGVVLDLTGRPARVALIARHDRRARLLWSLPKGHVESGETPDQAALREVHEETGLIGRVIAPLGVIDFWFVVEDKRIHKTVHHFVIEAIGGELSDEDIEVEAVEWVPFDQVVRRLAYGDERRLVEKVLGLVPGLL